MQPAAQLGIVHIRRPGVARGGFAVAGGGQHLTVRHRLVVVGADGRIEIGELDEFLLGDRVDVDDVASLAIADLDADRVGQHEVRDPGRRLDRHLGRDPAAERHADDHGVAQIELIEQVEVEIGEVVDGVERPRLLRAAEARVHRRQHPRARRQPIEHRRGRLDADAGMQEQQRPAGAALDQLHADAGDGDRGNRIGTHKLDVTTFIEPA